MPNKDGTGPEGKGPMTGRGMGQCNQKAPKKTDCLRGRGFGRKAKGRMSSDN